MHTRQHANVTFNRTNLFRITTVGTNAFVDDHGSHDFFLKRLEGFAENGYILSFDEDVQFVVFTQRFEGFFSLFFNRSDQIFASVTIFIVISGIDFVVIIRLQELNNRAVVKFRGKRFHHRHPAKVCKGFLSRDLVFNFFMSEIQGFNEFVFRDEISPCFNHHNRIFGTRNDQV